MTTQLPQRLALKHFVGSYFDDRVVPLLCDYIRIPNKSPNFDPQWQANGHMQRAAETLVEWVKAQAMPGLQVEIFSLPNRTPTILCEIPGQRPGNLLFYGHYDKQPEFVGWREGLSPWLPIIENGRLYGRGGADDGYALPCCIAALAGLLAQGITLPRCFLLIEGCEESGSPDLPFYIEALKARIGTPDLVVCLDAECGTYDRLWVTNSLRGLAIGTLEVNVLTEGVHSGTGSGIIPDSFAVLRRLLDRLDDPTDPSRSRLLPELTVAISDTTRQQAAQTAAILGDSVVQRFPKVTGLRALSDDPVELVLNNTWRPTLTITGAAGLPEPGSAGNTLRPSTTVKLSVRTPPTLDAEAAALHIARVLSADPPYGAQVKVNMQRGETGWRSPSPPPWLEEAVQAASKSHFNNDARYMGTGGTIPFMKMLGDRFPTTAFLVTGVLGPNANAHGPNEFLHLDYTRNLTCCVAEVLARFPQA